MTPAEVRDALSRAAAMLKAKSRPATVEAFARAARLLVATDGAADRRFLNRWAAQIIVEEVSRARRPG